MPARKTDDRQRFINKIAQDSILFREDLGPCRIYTGSKADKRGYGAFWLNGRNIGAHRAAYLLFVGPVPKGLFVCHKCDNPSCVEINHLFLGTSLDNNRDMARKGRSATGDNNGSRKYPERLNRGVTHHFHKLTDKDVLIILRLYTENWGSQYDIAKRFGVSRGTVANILKRKTWQHLPEIDPVKHEQHWALIWPEKGIRGEKNPNAKITRAIAEEIRRKHTLEKKSGTLLAREYGISRTTACKIIKGQLWAW